MANKFLKELELTNGTKVVIRSAEPDDAQGLLALFDSIVGEDKYNVTTVEDVRKLKMTIEKERDWIQEHNADGKIILVAQIDGTIVGAVPIENGKRTRIAHVAVLAISVLKEFRGLGVGKTLLQSAIDWAGEDPLIEKIGLGVFATNKKAIGLYRKMGFVEEGRRIKEIKVGPNNYVDSILMYRFVR